MGEVIIYSQKRIKGLRGKYIAPYFFEKRQLEKAEKVYADYEKIVKVCKEIGIECERITKVNNTKNNETKNNETKNNETKNNENNTTKAK